MAEAGAGQQRAFVKNLNRQTAQQIRESATATVKAMSEQVRPLARLCRWRFLSTGQAQILAAGVSCKMPKKGRDVVAMVEGLCRSPRV
jgi:hypothetical protein